MNINILFLQNKIFDSTKTGRNIILKVQSWSWLEANLHKSSTLSYMVN